MFDGFMAGEKSVCVYAGSLVELHFFSMLKTILNVDLLLEELLLKIQVTHFCGILF